MQYIDHIGYCGRDNSESLAHYGVKGMTWDPRKRKFATDDARIRFYNGQLGEDLNNIRKKYSRTSTPMQRIANGAKMQKAALAPIAPGTPAGSIHNKKVWDEKVREFGKGGTAPLYKKIEKANRIFDTAKEKRKQENEEKMRKMKKKMNESENVKRLNRVWDAGRVKRRNQKRATEVGRKLQNEFAAPQDGTSRKRGQAAFNKAIGNAVTSAYNARSAISDAGKYSTRRFSYIPSENPKDDVLRTQYIKNKKKSASLKELKNKKRRR